MGSEKEYAKARTLFEDSNSNNYYVLLSRTNQAYSRIENAFNNPFKILLLTGAPGTGKSYVLRRFYNDHLSEYNMFLYPSATFGNEALFEIHKKTFGAKLMVKDMEAVLEVFRSKVQAPIYILLDEAQLYTEERLEWIRMLSNEGIFRFVVVVHRVGQEDLLAKEHFKTRTFEVVEFSPIDRTEISRFIETKLLLGDLSKLADRFSRRNYECIYALTHGNLRDLNRVMHRTFDLLDYIEQTKPANLPAKMTNKILEMAALELGMVNG